MCYVAIDEQAPYLKQEARYARVFLCEQSNLCSDHGDEPFHCWMVTRKSMSTPASVPGPGLLQRNTKSIRSCPQSAAGI